MQAADTLQLKLTGVAMVIAPLLFGASTFFWQNGEYGVIAATLVALASLFYIPALKGLFGLVKTQMPWYAVIGLFIAIYGCISGISFGMLGYFSTIFHISHQTYLKTLGQYPISSGLLIFWAGPLFPLSLLVLGISLIRKKAVSPWLGILICLGGITFPLGRILRIELVGHFTDLLLAIPFITTGFSFMTNPKTVNK